MKALTGLLTAAAAIDIAAASYSIDASATAGNPFKGFAGNPAWSAPPYRASTEPFRALEFHYIPLNSVMLAGPSTYDWAALEHLLAAGATRSMHGIVRFFLDYPAHHGGVGLGVPQYLIDAGLRMTNYTDHGGGQSPDYHDVRLIDCLVDFATAFGAQYDGDQRLAAIQLGLVGHWGEWHTFPLPAWMPEESDRVRIVAAFDAAFNHTQLEIRLPYGGAANRAIGYHDDSFTYSTLSGAPNGGAVIDWFFQPTIVRDGASEAWTANLCGGELRPENQATAFSGAFGAPSANKQNFNLCVEQTHVSWMLNHYAFGTGYTGTELATATDAAYRMGYQFTIAGVSAHSSSDCGGTSTDPCEIVTITIAAGGVAPFYYDLTPALSASEPGCTTAQISTAGAFTLRLLQPGSSRAFAFSVAVAGSAGSDLVACLGSLSLHLDSNATFADKPVKLAHTYSGTGVPITVPGAPTPTSSPVVATTPPPPAADGSSAADRQDHVTGLVAGGLMLVAAVVGVV